MSITQAMGPRAGDHIEISNRWARVTVMKQEAGVYTVRGDCKPATFETPGEALEHTLAELAKYQHGRAD